MQNLEVLIIPDVHGRTFWKEAINKFPIDNYPNLQIVFLGDYLDPYTSYDGISKEEALDNFKEILSINDPRVTLLIGNHDWHYFVNLDTCRMDIFNHKEIKQLFLDNLHRFKVSKEIKLDNVNYVFSHAGFTQKWLNDLAVLARDEFNKNKEMTNEQQQWINQLCIINETYNFYLLEESLKHYNDPFYSAPLSMVSRDRGGYHPHGSCIWADVHEHLYNEDIKGIYQIFGHTITYPTEPKDFAISPQGHCWAMLDASQAFIMDIEGNIQPIQKEE